MSPKQFDRTRFDHIGVITEEKHGEENFVDATRVWVTNPRIHPGLVLLEIYPHGTKLEVKTDIYAG